MKLLCMGLYAAAVCFLVAALSGHSAAWAPAALLGFAATVTKIMIRFS